MKKLLRVPSGLWALWLCVFVAACTVQGDGQSPQLFPDFPALAEGTATLDPGFVEGDATEQPEITPETTADGIFICDRASPGRPIDVTIPDGSVFQPGDEFTKTWRLVNAGDCIWSEDYAIVWFSGEPMGSARIQFLDVPVNPGESVDFSVEMTAPQKNGFYQSNWKMRNAEGTLFGLGPQGDSPFWARICVSDGSTATAFIAPSQTPAPMIYQQGEVEVTAETRLDVDSGSVNIGDDDDVVLQLADGEIKLIPLENVLLGVVINGIVPTQNDCKQTPFSTEAIVLTDLSQDVYVCYESNQGLPGYLWLKAAESNKENAGAAFVTWFVP